MLSAAEPIALQDSCYSPTAAPAAQTGAVAHTNICPTSAHRSLFVHGTRYPFGSIEEVWRERYKLIPREKRNCYTSGRRGHDLGFKGESAS